MKLKQRAGCVGTFWWSKWRDAAVENGSRWRLSTRIVIHCCGSVWGKSRRWMLKEHFVTFIHLHVGKYNEKEIRFIPYYDSIQNQISPKFSLRWYCPKEFPKGKQKQKQKLPKCCLATYEDPNLLFPHAWHGMSYEEQKLKYPKNKPALIK